MNETETNSPAQTDLMDQVVALQHQVFTLLLALVVVTGTLASYLWYHSHTLSKDIDGLRPQVVQWRAMLDEFGKDQPTAEAFINQLRAYGVTHPDYQPILKKYGLTPQPLPTPAAPAKKK